jgi:hypothetical protein
MRLCNLSGIYSPLMIAVRLSIPSVYAMDHVDVLAEWKAIPATDAIVAIVSRVSNRVFVGMPLCKNHPLPSHIVITEFLIARPRS